MKHNNDISLTDNAHNQFHLHGKKLGFINNIKTSIFFLPAGSCLIALGDEIVQKSDGPYVPLNERGDTAFMKPTYATQQYES